jgi:hypothetical protein
MTMRTTVLLLFLAACSKAAPPAAQFRASCKPDANHDNMECTVENIGKKPARACVTSREQVPKKQTLVARRICTAVLEPGKTQLLHPRYDGLESLQALCAPDGTWLCTDEIVESPEMLGENIPGQAP